MSIDHVIIHTDGGARGNPGPGGIGVVIMDQDRQVLKEHQRFLGTVTNNQAEYQAVIDALEVAAEMGVRQIDFFLDSELVVKQLRGEYKVKDAELGKLYVKIWNLSQGFGQISYQHVLRAQNKQADALVNAAIDAAM